MSILRFGLAATFVCVAASQSLGDTFYATGTGGIRVVPFGRIDASGNTTPIGSGLNFGSSDENATPQLLAAPNGTLYAFDTNAGGAYQSWGTVNPTTGVFTKIGNLGSVFGYAGQGSPILGFDSSGDLIAAGYSTTNNPIFGTLNLTTGAFTSTANASTGVLNDLAEYSTESYGSGHIVTVVPEPSAIALLLAGAMLLAGGAFFGRTTN